jgi:hypothetical protein
VHKHPLLDALDHGFCSVEADVHLLRKKLFVAHDLDQVREERSLEGLYLKPLRKLAQEHGGRIFPGLPSLTLLIDVKSDADPAYETLREALKKHPKSFTQFHEDKIETNAITVIVTGNRARKIMESEDTRYAAIDGRIEDLDSAAPASLIPLISDNWTKYFKWNGVGEMPDDQRKKLHDFVTKAHAHGRRLRFWSTPDKPEVWKELFDAGVDLIGGDDLDGLEKFLRSRAK